jgi:hypothetical protein
MQEYSQSRLATLAIMVFGVLMVSYGVGDMPVHLGNASKTCLQ